MFSFAGDIRRPFSSYPVRGWLTEHLSENRCGSSPCAGVGDQLKELTCEISI